MPEASFAGSQSRSRCRPSWDLAILTALALSLVFPPVASAELFSCPPQLVAMFFGFIAFLALLVIFLVSLGIYLIYVLVRGGLHSFSGSQKDLPSPADEAEGKKARRSSRLRFPQRNLRAISNFIVDAMNSGHPKEQILRELKIGGWTEDEIREGFEAVTGTPFP